ncbi:MAG: rhodanese-like domain-containing protein [Candidatus Kerfeldbacteria bacterium]|nr:rhodanese-like domain-containing protein [Candidatus Kerfeldbacteria bacterium]
MFEWEISTKDYLRLRAHGTPHRLVDVRTIPEFNGAHVNGAEFITLSKFAAEFPEKLPSKNEKIILYCAHGERSMMATEMLRTAGYTDAWSLAGGYETLKTEL